MVLGLLRNKDKNALGLASWPASRKSTRRFLWMLKEKGVSHLLWFVLAFVVVLILIVVGLLILKQGETYAMKGVDDLMKSLGEMIS